MRIKNKTFYLIFQCIKNVYASKSRFFLSLLGIALSSLLCTMGIILIDSYFLSEINKFSPYDYNTIAVSNIDMDDMKSLDNITSHRYTYQKELSYLFRSIDGENGNISILIDIYGASYGFTNYLIPTFENENMLYKPSLVYGRSFVSKDFLDSSVCIIDQLTSEVVFGITNAVGAQLQVPVYEETKEVNGVFSRDIISYKNYTVVGIINNSNYTNNNRLGIIQSLKNFEGNEEYSLNVFIPQCSNKAASMVVMRSIENIKNEDILSKISFSGQIYTLDSISSNIKKQQGDMNLAIQIIFLLLIIILGFNLMNIIFFSVKERIKEIGIKKALGALDEEIMLSIIIEGFIIGIAGVLVGMLSGVLISTLISALIKSIALPTLTIYIDPIKLPIILLICLSLSILFSIFPAIYASRTKIVDAIRFE